MLSHDPNAGSIAEIRAVAGAEKSALGEDDAIVTHARLLAEADLGQRIYRNFDDARNSLRVRDL